MIDVAQASEWTFRPPLLSGAEPLFVLRIVRDQGAHLRAGGLAFVKATQLPRPGGVFPGSDHLAMKVACIVLP
ncbi:MAG: hypothetical protein M0Z28_29945 [Rhodospirillales bacterium]|nr:hypothetical protein [Rhodospirillales bacterium]